MEGKSYEAFDQMPNLPIDARRRMEMNTHWLSGSARAAGDERAQMEPRNLRPDGSGSSCDTARGCETQDHDVSVSNPGLNITAVDDGAFYDQFEEIDRLKRGNRGTMSNEGCHAPPTTSNEIESCRASEEEVEEDEEVLLQEQLDTMVKELRELRARIGVLIVRMKALDGDLDRMSKETPEAFHKMMSQHGEQIADLRQRIPKMELQCNSSITWADDAREGQVYGDSDGMDDEAESRE